MNMRSLFKAHLKHICADAGTHPTRLFAVFLALVLVVTAVNPVRSEVYDQDQVKAVFIYNLSNFITWPAKGAEGESVAFTIGVFGRDTLTNNLERTVSGESVGNRSIIVRHFKSLNDIASVPCDLLFINGDQMHLWPQIREMARRYKILTVSDVESFGRRGGIVALLTSGRKIRIEINLDEGRRNGFEFSAKLLNLADIVTVGKDD